MQSQGITKTELVKEYITGLIEKKELSDDGRIPSENILTEKLGVSRVTVRRALAELYAAGSIRTERGKGSFAVGYNKSLSDISVAVIISSLEKESRFLDIYSGIQNYLSNKNITTTLLSSDYRVANEKTHINSMIENGCKNLIVMPIALEDNSAFYREHIKNGVNIVFIDQKPSELSCNYVHSDNISGGFEMTEHLISLGHKRIAYIYQEIPEISSSTADRISGYKSALKANGISCSPELICFTNRRICDKTIDHLLSLEAPPTAIFASNDYLAYTIYELLILKGINVPSQISLAGFDNLSILSPDAPPFTTVDQDFYSIGYNAAKCLYNIMEETSRIISDISIPITPLFRGTTAKPNRD